MSRRETRAALAGAGLGALVGTALALGAALPAWSHDYLADSTPTEGETLSSLPESWSVSANNPLLALDGNEKAFAIIVTDSEGRYYGDGCVDVDGPTMTAPALLGGPGDYTMTFQYVSSDGHTLSDSIGFSYAPTGEQPVSEGSIQPPACGGEASGDETSDAAGAPGAAVDDGAAVLGAVAWIGGGLLAAAAVAAIVVLANRRRPAGD